MQIIRLHTNHLENPLGFDASRVLLSWTVVESKGHWQAAAQIQIAANTTDQIVYDTGKCANTHDEQTGRILSGPDNLGWELPCKLQARTRYFWRVCVWTDAGEEVWSDWAWFETAKSIDEPWHGKMITSSLGPNVNPIIQHRFSVNKSVRSARMYCLGLGVYEAYLNGQKLGDEVLMPGLHTYDGYLQYQTLELEPLAGENTIAFLMGEGWYKGRYGLKSSSFRYGKDYALMAEIWLRYEDGTEEVICTDESWQVRRNPVVFDSIYDGETIDANVLADDTLYPVVLSDLGTEKLCPRVSPCLRIQETVKPVAVEAKEQIFDFGQNMVGWIAFECDAPAGTTVTIKFAEIMRDGTLYRDNLRTAEQIFTYVSDGQKHLVRPHFTFFGFRYLSVEGWQTTADAFTGLVIHSDMERTGWIETANPKVNRLFENAIWSQKGNFVDVPTDCPQRDERMGWTGDIQIFADTALYNTDCVAFLNKFLKDLRWDQQQMDGAVPCVVPMTGYTISGVTAWGDAAAVVPWFMYLHSGDTGILRASLKSMTDWVDWIGRQTQIDQTGYLWTKSLQLGDWLALDGNSVYGGTDRGLIATAYYYYSAKIAAESADILGEKEIAEQYSALASNIRSAFVDEYFTPSGRLAVETQTACAVTSYLGLVPEGAQNRVNATLRKKVVEAGIRLDTGFVGTPWLMQMLTSGGSVDLAYGLLLREEYPGWLYEVNLDATTIWERWNSIEPDGSMNRDGMNSFNHYSYGSVAAWMYRTMGGIAPTTDVPGFRYIDCKPIPDRRMPWSKVKVMTGSGMCAVEWKWNGDNVSFDVEVPFGCMMRLQLPDNSAERLLESGVYHYEIVMPKPVPSGLEAPWRELLSNDATREAISRTFPRAVRGIPFQYEMYTMEQVTQSPFSELSREDIRRIEDAIIRAQSGEGSSDE